MFISKNLTETMNFAKRFAKNVKKGDIILLEGDLGAGKTHFVKGFALGLKCKSSVTSPTFTIMNLYEGGRLKIYHFDMYRLSSSEEASELGFDEYLSPETLDGVSLVEWGSNVDGLIKNWSYKITISKGEKDDIRIIEIEEGKC